MPKTTGYYATENGSKYLQQLCKHFGHKIEVEYTEATGTCSFDFGTANMKSDEKGLTVRFDLDSADAFNVAHDVIDSHLVKFAFREDFKGMSWTN